MWPAVDKVLYPSGRSIRLTMPLVLPDPLPANLGDYVREIYRRHFANELALGNVKPLVIPYGVLTTFGLPILYFSIPHRDRPWLFRARYLLMLYILAFNLRETFTTSSPNFAVGYAVGLMQAWGLIWNMTLLVLMRPQFDAERVERRLAQATTDPQVETNGSTNGHARLRDAKEDVRPAQNGNAHAVAPMHGSPRAPVQDTKLREAVGGRVVDAPDEDIARSIAEGYEYYWQGYPAEAPFSTRFGWSFDLCTSFRGTGWNWSVPVVPRFSKPDKPQSAALADLSSIPMSTPQGYRRFATSRSWLRSELGPILAGYLALDLLSVLMMKDPYFILGPEYTASVVPIPLPPPLAVLPPWLLFTYRSLTGFVAIIAAICTIMKLWQLVCAFPLRPLLGTRAELWHYPTLYGGFVSNVMDKGLAGFWGGWWHQTFRVAFSAPGTWLTARHGILADLRSPAAKASAGFFAFAQSGLLHCLGSISCLPPSRPLAPPVFFMLSWAGILLQTAACGAARPATRGLPRWAKRAGNFAFVFLWLNASQYWMLDDIARSGIWLLEPVPVSLFRALGLGRPGDSWWRWTWAELPRLHAGAHWWDSGVAL